MKMKMMIMVMMMMMITGLARSGGVLKIYDEPESPNKAGLETGRGRNTFRTRAKRLSPRYWRFSGTE